MGSGVGVGTGVGVGGIGVGVGVGGTGVGVGASTDRLTVTTAFAGPIPTETWPVYVPGPRLPGDVLILIPCEAFEFKAPLPGEAFSQPAPSLVSVATDHLP